MANNLKLLRKQAKLSQTALAEIMNTSRDQLAKLESGSRRLSDIWIARAAKALSVDPGELVTDSFTFAPVQLPSPRRASPKGRTRSRDGGAIQNVPLLDSVAAGKLVTPSSQIPVEDVPLLAFADLGPGEFFALTVAGSSMDRVSPEGSKIVVNRRDRVLVSGKCYVFGLRGATTFKRWHGGDPEYLEPYSIDPSHEPVFLRKKKDWECIGRVVRTVLDL